MNSFERHIAPITGGVLYGLDMETMQVNLGFLCNQQCAHCHVAASPYRTEVMAWPTMELVCDAARRARCRLVDLTGGEPELNPHFQRFVRALRQNGHRVQVRTNLSILTEPGYEGLPEFFREHEVQLVASLPCYREENVAVQRGAGVYGKSIRALQRLNTLGYGSEPRLALSLVYNPRAAFLPAPQAKLQTDYRRELKKDHGVVFSHLLTIANMPIGRFLEDLQRRNKVGEYLRLLTDAFNPLTLEGLMCRHQVSVGWDGTLFDCDFNLALGLASNHGAPHRIRDFDSQTLATRRIVTGEHCFGCTAGCGSSCGGALV